MQPRYRYRCVNRRTQFLFPECLRCVNHRINSMLRGMKRRFFGRNASDGTLDEGERGKPHEDSAPTPVGFWDPSLKSVRNKAFGKWLLTTAFLMAFILAVLSIYWGVFFGVQKRLHHLSIYVVDFDGQAPYNIDPPIVGPAITQMTQKMVDSGQPTLGFDIRSPTEFENDPLQVRQSIYNFDAWAAIIINPNGQYEIMPHQIRTLTHDQPLHSCIPPSPPGTRLMIPEVHVSSSFRTLATILIGTISSCPSLAPI